MLYDRSGSGAAAVALAAGLALACVPALAVYRARLLRRPEG
jgi:hypothetical protein